MTFGHLKIRYDTMAECEIKFAAIGRRSKSGENNQINPYELV